MENQKFITPTKQSPVFVAECDYFGFIETTLYKEYAIDLGDNCTSIGSTFALTYTDAIVRLHKYIVENNLSSEYPKCKFNIYMVDGSVKNGEKIYNKVYTITAKQSKLLL